MMEKNRFGVERLPFECEWIFESVHYGRYREYPPCTGCPNQDKCKPPEKEKKRSGYILHTGSIKPIKPPEYNRWGDRMYQATCPNCGKSWRTKFSQKTTCGSQGGKKGCGYRFRSY